MNAKDLWYLLLMTYNHDFQDYILKSKLSHHYQGNSFTDASCCFQFK